MVRTLRFRAACQHPRCTFVARGSTKLASQTGLRRHVREKHGGEVRGSGRCEQRRRQQQAERQRALRSSRPLLSQGSGHKHLFVVTSPVPREAMWLQTRDRLIQGGVAAECIVRRVGIDFAAYRQNHGRHPVGLTRSTFLMHDFHKGFLPLCRQRFENNQQLQYIWWVEDDCSFKKGQNATTLHARALAGRACLLWAGYTNKHGGPCWGSHLAAVTRSGLKALQKQMDDEEAKLQREGSRLSYLVALDTWFRRGLAIQHRGKPLVQAFPESGASQVQHERQGRR